MQVSGPAGMAFNSRSCMLLLMQDDIADYKEGGDGMASLTCRMGHCWLWPCASVCTCVARRSAQLLAACGASTRRQCDPGMRAHADRKPCL